MPSDGGRENVVETEGVYHSPRPVSRPRAAALCIFPMCKKKKKKKNIRKRDKDLGG